MCYNFTRNQVVSCCFNFNLKHSLTLKCNVKISTNYVYTATLGFLSPSGDEKLQKMQKYTKLYLAVCCVKNGA